MKLSNIISLISCLLLLGSCGKGEKRVDTVTEYFYHGDPLQMIEGATLNQTSFLSSENYKEFHGYHLVSGVSLVEAEEKYNPSGWDEVEDNANTDDVDDDALIRQFTPDTFDFEKDGDVYRLFSLSSELSLEFVDEAGTLALTTINTIPVTILHYSLKEDQSAFSFLVEYYSGPENGKALLALTFASTVSIEDLPEAVSDYSYLYSNIPMSWNESVIEMDACGTFDSQETVVIQSGVSQWLAGEAESDGTSVKLNFAESYAPFSDLNQHCIMLVHDFKLENSDNFYVAGVAFPSVSKASNLSLIMIFSYSWIMCDSWEMITRQLPMKWDISLDSDTSLNRMAVVSTPVSWLIETAPSRSQNETLKLSKVFTKVPKSGRC